MNTQNLDSFTQFIEFVKNVDNFSVIVNELKQATKENQKVLDLLTEGKSLKAYEDKLNAVEAQLEFERKEFDKSCQVQNDVLVKRAKDLNDVEAKLNTRKSELDEQTSNVDSFSVLLQQRKVDLDKKESDLNALIADNNKVAKELQNKVTQLATLMA